MGSFVSDTLRSLGRDMRSKQLDEEDVEEHVSFLTRGLVSVD